MYTCGYFEESEIYTSFLLTNPDIINKASS